MTVLCATVERASCGVHFLLRSCEAPHRLDIYCSGVGCRRSLRVGASQQTWCLTSTETLRLIRDGENGGRRFRGGGRGGLYTYHYTVTTRMTPDWAAGGAILMLHNCEGQSRKTVSTDCNFSKRNSSRSGFEPSPSAYQLNGLPLGQTGSQWE